ncbi:hypothetical protein BJX70DRAFT_189498 [Aspergillus crustosus]
MDIQLVDNTAPAERLADDTTVSKTTTTTSTGSRLWNRPSIREERRKRKYAKWQPERLGVTNDPTDSELSSDERELLRAGTNTNILTSADTIHESVNGYQADSYGPEQTGEQVQQQQSQQQQSSGENTRTTHQSKNHPKICGLKPNNELDILYENQRGWFFFGIPLYSDRSLLNLDPAPWLNAAGKQSFVNITNAQVPDPSWEWAWKTWYVDMSGDVDEQGWQYSFSFGSSPWHGTHPFWHSFVRRRRWVRLRIKRNGNNRQGRSGLEMAHRLTEDYFTIHSAVKTKRASMAGSERASRPPSQILAHNGVDEEEEIGLDEIRSIPALMYALKGAIVDREKLDAVKTFVDEGGPELYYLNGRIPEIMTRLVYQASRWQLLTYLKDTIEDLSQKQQEQDSLPDKQVSEDLSRKQEYLSRAAGTAEHHLTSPEVLQEPSESKRESVPELLDLTPGTKRDSLLSRFSGRFSFKPIDNGGEIKGIPREAEIGHDFHIY